MTAVTGKFCSNKNRAKNTKHFLKLRSRIMLIPLRSKKYGAAYKQKNNSCYHFQWCYLSVKILNLVNDFVFNCPSNFSYGRKTCIFARSAEAEYSSCHTCELPVDQHLILN